MPGPRVVSVQGDEALPSRVDVVVVGGGIVGASTALELAERGLDVALCEKGEIGGEQSSRNWGWVRITRRDPRELALMAEALRIWPDLQSRTGRDLGYRRTGIGFACHSDADLVAAERSCEQLGAFQLKSDVLRGSDVAERLPGLQESVKGVQFTPADGRAEPQMAAPAIAEAARDHGASLLTGCAVRGIETAGGRVSAAVTERGAIACDAVVLAGGAWSRLFSGNLGIDLPQLKVMNTVMRTHPLANGPEVAYWTREVAFRKRQDGGYTIANGSLNYADIVPDSFRLAVTFLPALIYQWRDLRLRLGGRFLVEAGYARKWSLDAPTPFEHTRILDPEPHRRTIASTLAKAAEIAPVFAGARVAQSWAGLIDVTPDALPVISPVDALPGFHIATGFSGHGFGIGPAAGRLMAEIVSGASPCVDPHDFRLSRFSDGTKIVIDGGI